jgi:xanthine dehydrogenase YagR molybdenum-binding subunit
MPPHADPVVSEHGNLAAALGRSSAVGQVDAQPRDTVCVGGTDVGPGAQTTMGMMAAEAPGVPLAQGDVVSGDTARCPDSGGEAGRRTTIMTGMAVVEAVPDLQQQMAAHGMPTGNAVLGASAPPTPVPDGSRRPCFGAHCVDVAVDTRLGTTRMTPSGAVQESGRRLHPQTAREQLRGAVLPGIGQALHEALWYDPASGHPLTSGYDRARHLTHLDVPASEGHVLEVDDGCGPDGGGADGAAGIILAPAAVANAIVKATGIRMTSQPMTRDKLLGALRCKP